MLIRQLPPESSTNTAIRVAAGPDALAEAGDSDPADGKWSHSDMLLAAIVDAIRGLHWSYAAAHAKSAPPRPKPLPRPGATQRRKTAPMTAAQYRMLTGEAPPLHLIQGGG